MYQSGRAAVRVRAARGRIRQDARPARLLDLYQREIGFAVECRGALGVGGECSEVGGVAEVREQQESLRQILGVNRRHMHARFGEESCDFQVRTTVLVFWRGIHDDARRAVGQRDAGNNGGNWRRPRLAQSSKVWPGNWVATHSRIA